MPAIPTNPNLTRRPLPGLLVRLLTPILKPMLGTLQRRDNLAPGWIPGWTVYASYMVGDFFMALPALKHLKKSAARDGLPLRVICRPDCAEFLAREGIEAIPFADAFRVRPGVGSFLRTARAARMLRGRLDDTVLDLDADPRTAFWLKLAGARTVSYRRSFNALFDETFPLPEPSIHQADRDMRVVEEWVKRVGSEEWGVKSELKASPTPPSLTTQHSPLITSSAPWLISLWTRKAEKNWPLGHWEALLEGFVAEGIPFLILTPPDAGAAFLKFQQRWAGRAPFLRGSLTQIADAVRTGAGVIATDNFLGHMAGYYGKPVLWINLCSPAEQVEPRGPRTIAVTNPSVEEARRAFVELNRGS